MSAITEYVDSVDPWGKLNDFAEPARPTFPIATLPSWLAEFVDALAIGTQTPPDLGGCLTLTAIAAALARRYEVHARPDWIEPTNIYGAVVLPPGHRKSAVFSYVNAPMQDAERDACISAREPIAEAQARAKALDAKIKNRERAIAKLDDGPEAKDALAELARLHVDRQALVIPPFPKYAVDDCTPERLAGLLAIHGGRMGVFSAEGTPFDIFAGRYAKDGSPNLSVALKGHSGDELRIDRQGRPPEYVRKPAITMGLTIQPDVLRSIQAKPGFRGRGFLARILWCLPTDVLGDRDPDPEAVPETVRALYRRRLISLWLLPSVEDDRGEIIATPLPFDWPARDRIVAFLEEIEPRLGPGGDLHPFTEWAAKLAGAVVRLAGILHMADRAGQGNGDPGEIDAPTVERAITLGSYFLEHALIAYRTMKTDPTVDDAADLGAWITKQAKAGELTFSKRDAHHARQHRFESVTDLDPALDYLVAHNWIRPAVESSPRKPGRPASPKFDINPMLAG